MELPHQFKSSETHLDTLSVPHPNGLSFPKHVESSPWSRKVGLSGRPVLELKVWELAYYGVQEQSLRHLANGRFVSLVFCRSVSETVLVNKLLQCIRSKTIDIDQAARQLFVEAFPGKSVPDKRESSSEYIQPLIDGMMQAFPQSSASQPELQQAERTILELRAQLQAMSGQGQGLRMPTTNAPSEAAPEDVSPHPEVTEPLVVTPKAKMHRAASKSRVRSRSPRRHQSTLPFSRPGEASGSRDAPQTASSPVASAINVDEVGKPHVAFVPKGKPLESAFPPGHQVRVVAQWIEESSKFLPRSSKDMFQSYSSELQALWESMGEDSKPNLVDLAKQWGLPPDLASKIKPNGLLQIIALAAVLSA